MAMIFFKGKKRVMTRAHSLEHSLEHSWIAIGSQLDHSWSTVGAVSTRVIVLRSLESVFDIFTSLN